jgi:hypothetical protein
MGRVHNDRRRVSRHCENQLLEGRVHLAAHHGDHGPHFEVLHFSIGPLQYLRRRTAFEGIGTEHTSDSADNHCRVEAMTRDIGNDDPDLPVGKSKRVIPVAPPLSGLRVTGSGQQTRDLGGQVGARATDFVPTNGRPPVLPPPDDRG